MSWRGIVCLSSAALVAALAAAPVAAQTTTQPPPGPQSLAAPKILVLAGDANANTVVQQPRPRTDAADVATATASVTYTSDVIGTPTFPPAAQAAVQAAIDIWMTYLSSSVPITITANWHHFTANVLAGAGPSRIYKNFDNAPVADTYYPSALAEAIAGHAFSGSDPDVSIDINDRSDWSYRTDGTPVSNQFDLESVILHELAHGWGFLGTMDISSGKGMYGIPTDPNAHDIYDSFSQDLNGASLLSYPNNSTSLAAALQSNNVYFSSPQTNQGSADRVRLFAPSSWLGGSSFAHLDENTYPAGDPDSLVTPYLNRAEVIHSPGPKTLCVLEALGWRTPQSCSATPETQTQGFTWYGDGAASKSGPTGTVITAFATGVANTSYKLVTGRDDGTGEPCRFDTVAVNPNVRFSNSRGFIANTSGPVNRPAGDWQVCFRQEGTGTMLRVSLPVGFTVTG